MEIVYIYYKELQCYIFIRIIVLLTLNIVFNDLHKRYSHFVCVSQAAFSSLFFHALADCFAILRRMNWESFAILIAFIRYSFKVDAYWIWTMKSSGQILIRFLRTKNRWENQCIEVYSSVWSNLDWASDTVLFNRQFIRSFFASVIHIFMVFLKNSPRMVY